MSLVSTTTFEDGTVDQEVSVGGAVTSVSGAAVYSTRAAHGNLGFTSLPGTPGPSVSFSVPGSGDEFAVSIYAYGESTTGGSATAVWFADTSGVMQAGVRFHPQGNFDICNSSHIQESSTTAEWSLGQWYRIDTNVTQNAGSITVTARIFSPSDSETLLDTTTATFPVSSPITTLEIGTHAAKWSLSFDTVRLYDSSDLITAFAPVATEPTPGTVLHNWVGAVTHDEMQVKAKTLNTPEAWLAVSTNVGMTNPILSSHADPDSDGYIRLDLGGLTSGTQYYYQLVDETGNIGDVGKARTLPTPGLPSDFTVALGSCTLHNLMDGVAHTDIRSWEPDFMIHTGDFYYTSSESTSPSTFEGLYSNMIQTYPGHAELCRDVPMWSCASDHEAGPDNGDSDNDWTKAHIAAFDQVVPHRVEDTRIPMRARYQSWVAGRVRFIMTDVRTLDRSPGANTDSSSKTMIGATQMAWLKSELLQPEPLKIIVTDPGWMGDYSLENGTDKWWSYATERQEVIDFISANSLQVEVWHGDSHSLGVKGNNNPWGGFPVLCGSPLAQTGGGRNLGEFDSSYGSGITDARQYMRISFTDDGETITRSASGWDAANSIERVSSVETYSTLASSSGSVIVGGSKKPVTSRSVILGGVKKDVTSVSVVIGGVKKPQS